MAGRRPDYRQTTRSGSSLADVGRRAATVGVAVVSLSAPVALLTGVLLFGGTTPVAALDGAAALLSADAAALVGLELAFHLAALVGLAGTWVLGAGLLVEGLFE
jgi:hypothetical protein